MAYKRLSLVIVSVLVPLVAVIILMTVTSRPCLACGSQDPPSPCGVNLSAMTIKQSDDRNSWWDFLSPRDKRIMHVYLGLNNNQGSGTRQYAYQIAYSGDWDPAIAGVVTPTLGAGELGPAGTKQANQTIEISVPYSTTQTGSLVLTATVTSVDGLCIFRTPVTTTLQINDTGPTVWPVTPRTCTPASAKPRLTFGIRNPNDKAETYTIVARSVNPVGGDASDQFNLNGAGSEADLGQMTLRPGEAEKIKIDCETFGYCMTGGENQVHLEVTPLDDPATQATAWSNVTIRDPESVCPEIKDWWFFMPTTLLAGLIGIPSALAIGSGAAVLRPKRPERIEKPNSRGGISKDPQETTNQPGSGKDISHGRPRPK